VLGPPNHYYVNIFNPIQWVLVVPEAILGLYPLYSLA
jgi:hypothetical protein